MLNPSRRAGPALASVLDHQKKLEAAQCQSSSNVEVALVKFIGDIIGRGENKKSSAEKAAKYIAAAPSGQSSRTRAFSIFPAVRRTA